MSVGYSAQTLVACCLRLLPAGRQNAWLCPRWGADLWGVSAAPGLAPAHFPSSALSCSFNKPFCGPTVGCSPREAQLQGEGNISRPYMQSVTGRDGSVTGRGN